MSVTLEQARQLHHHHSLAKDHVLSAANAMRGHGTQRTTCYLAMTALLLLQDSLQPGPQCCLALAPGAATFSTGVRLEVCRKNIGKPRYAFNALQVKLLPSVYRPPAHTTSSNVST